MPYVTVRGLRVSYDREGSGPPMLLVHGAAQDSTSWRFNLPYFAQWYDVVVMDLPGHGKPQFAKEGPVRLVETYADFVWGLIEALHMNKPIIAGHSLGGAICLRVAVDHPSGVAAVIDVDGSAETNADTTGYQGGLLELVAINPTDWMETNFLSLLGRTTSLDRKREMASDARRVAPEVVLGDLYAYTSCNFFERLKSIKVPVLALVGGDDWSCSPELVKRNYDAIVAPKEYVIWSGVGHVPHTEQPDVFNETVRGLLEKHGL